MFLENGDLRHHSLLQQCCKQLISQQQQQKTKAEFKKKMCHCDTMQNTGRCLYLEQFCELQSYSQRNLLGGMLSHTPL